MRRKSQASDLSSEEIVKDIRRATRKRYSVAPCRHFERRLQCRACLPIGLALRVDHYRVGCAWHAGRQDQDGRNDRQADKASLESLSQCDRGSKDGVDTAHVIAMNNDRPVAHERSSWELRVPEFTKLSAWPEPLP